MPTKNRADLKCGLASFFVYMNKEPHARVICCDIVHLKTHGEYKPNGILPIGRASVPKRPRTLKLSHHLLGTISSIHFMKTSEQNCSYAGSRNQMTNQRIKISHMFW